MEQQGQVREIISKVKVYANGPSSASLGVWGIDYKVNYGVSIAALKEIAEDYKGNHELALSLYEQDVRECMIIASLIDDPEQVKGEQIDSWAQKFTNVEIVEQVCSNLLWKTDCALSRSIEWCLSDDELLQKAGLIVAARSASNPNIKDVVFEPYLDIIDGLGDRSIANNKNNIEFALRQIAQRNDNFKNRVVEFAKELASADDEHRAWIGNQLLFEFDEV